MTDRRAELLAAATGWVLENGLGGLSLRPLAAALDTSDRMLLYYFTSKDKLVAEIATGFGDTLAAGLPTVDPASPPSSARVWLDGVWHLFTDPMIQPAMMLLLELDAMGMRHPGPVRDAARRVSSQWVAAVGDALFALGVGEDRRTAMAKVVGAALVGLVLEALVVHDGGELVVFDDAHARFGVDHDASHPDRVVPPRGLWAPVRGGVLADEQGRGGSLRPVPRLGCAAGGSARGRLNPSGA